MSDTIPLRLGTRRSPLAMAQAEEVRQRLCAAHGWAADVVEFVPIVTSADRVQDRPLADIGGKALWTRELETCLAEGRIDAAVHSMKDVETIRPTDLTIAAVLPRADVRDVLIGASSILALPQGAVVGTSAPRRAAQLRHARPDCRIVSIRGNIATRLAKRAAGDMQATFLAAAGLDRLGEIGVGTPLDPLEWLPAPAQGAIGVECNAADDRVRSLLAAIDHQPSHAQVIAERALLFELGGNCHSPVAALTRPDGAGWTIRVRLWSPDGAETVTGETGFAANLAPVRALAADLLARATPGIAPHFGGPA